MAESKPSEPNKRKFDWLSSLIVLAAISFLFVRTYKTEGLQSAFLFVATMYAFPVSFGIPYLIKKLRSGRDQMETLIILSLYLVSLVTITIIAKDWRVFLMFPATAFLWWLCDWIYKVLKDLLT